ncbi:MAG TPA: OB-fold domain-containing protein [Stellaceae bacterium]|nr:OB-fold domain-containing protein [Stellaceae bacterium]
MTGGMSAYPQPHADADNHPLIEGWREGRLMIQVCGGCSHTFFYPRPLCPYCWSAELSWKAASGRGTIVSFSLVNRPNAPAFFAEVPIILAEIRLDEEVLLIARVIAREASSIRSGLPVELVSGPEAARYPLPTFRPRQ